MKASDHMAKVSGTMLDTSFDLLRFSASEAAHYGVFNGQIKSDMTAGVYVKADLCWGCNLRFHLSWMALWKESCK